VVAGVAVVHSRVVASHGLSLAFSLSHTPEKIEQEVNWLAMVDERRDGDESLQREQFKNVGHFRGCE